MQSASDIFLGWEHVALGIDGASHDYYVRQLWDWKVSADVATMKLAELIVYGKMCAWTLARAHGRTGDPIAINAYLGKSDVAIRALAEFAGAYADQNKRDKAFITSVLDPAAQARALKEMNLPATLNLPPAKVITHDEGIELNSETTGRLSQSSAPCYYDVVVRQLFYFKSATTKGKMRTFIMVRGADGNTRVVDYKDSANHALDVKLPKEGEDATEASRALIDAFKADVSEFSAKFVRKTAPKT